MAMEMTTTEVTLRMLKPSGDLWLTRKTVADGEERIFSKEVYLGTNDSADNWMEVDEDYKSAYEKSLQTEREVQTETEV